MKWKDSVDMADEEEQTREEFFDEERNSPWSDRKDSKMLRRINRPPVLFVLLALAVVALVSALIMLLWGGSEVSSQTINALEDKIRQLEERLDKYEAIDEKVTRIWEHAKSYEKFRDRFDRSEASNSLRMDHMTTSLETVQKQLAELRKNPAPAAAAPIVSEAAAVRMRYHEVAPNETLYSISKMHDLKVEDLLRMNQMSKNDVLRIGQKLVVGGAAAKN